MVAHKDRDTLRARQHQRGNSALEFLAGAVPVLLLGFGAVETIHWYSVRGVLDHALLQTARAASTLHANPETITQVFTQSLRPLHPADRHTHRPSLLTRTVSQIEEKTGRAAWEIRIASPDANAFAVHADTALGRSQPNGYPVINNHYQYEQHTRSQALHNTTGTDQSIYQANTLTLELTYLKQPLLRGVSQLLKIFGQRNGNYSQHALSHGYWPIKARISVIMQTHPVLWPLPDTGYIQRAGEAPKGNKNKQGMQDSLCTGLWCTRGQPQASPPLPPKPAEYPGHGEGAYWPEWGSHANYPQSNPVTPTPGTTPDGHSLPAGHLAPPGTPAGDPACGVTLCCF